MEIHNFYTSIKQEKSDQTDYPNFDKMNIKLPFRALLCGPSGSGKTNVVLNLLKGINAFDQIILLAKNLGEILYKHLIDSYQKIEKKHKIQLILPISDIKDLPPVKECDPKKNTLLIIDDMICENAKDLAKVSEYFIRGRKNNVSMCFLTQSYFDTPKMVRKNVNYVIIKKIGNPMDLKRILKEWSLGVTVEELQEIYDSYMEGGDMTRFFMIDLETNKPQLRFRRNFG